MHGRLDKTQRVDRLLNKPVQQAIFLVQRIVIDKRRQEHVIKFIEDRKSKQIDRIQGK